MLAVYTVDKQSGIIEPLGKVTINVTLEAKMLDEFRLPMRIEVLGNEAKASTLNIIVFSHGPEVDVIDPPNKILDFGTVEVLEDFEQTITLYNKSKIDAEFHAFTREPGERSWFKPEITKGVIKAE